MSNTITYVLELKDRSSDKIKRLGIGAQKGSAGMNSLRSRLDAATISANRFGNASQRANTQASPLLNTIKSRIGPLIALSAIMYKIGSYIGKSVDGYKEEAVAQSKLFKVMDNTTGATVAQKQAIIDLASAQQKIGVIGDEVQLAGAAELATYVTKTKTIEKLLPAMNDMIAHQYGLEASQEAAFNTATMLGKVLQGQTGALSRYGYSFTKAQEKILKTGTEAERAAVLFDVITESVGGVNAALAATPEGKLQQHANNMGDIQEKVGKLVIQARVALIPFMKIVGKAIEKIVEFAEWFGRLLKRAAPVLVIITGLTLAYYGTLLALKVPMIAVMLKTMLWTSKQWLLNAALSLNPIGVVIALIVALIAVIAYVAYTTEGWGKTWSNMMEMMKLEIAIFKDAISLAWLGIKDTFLSGFEVIERGWYKLRRLWDKEGANSALQKLESERDQRAQEILNKSTELQDKITQHRNMKVWEVKSTKSFGDVKNDIKRSLGITPAEDILGATTAATGPYGAGGEDGGGGSNAGSSADAIATGGTRTTNITIDVKSMIENIIFNGGTKENQQEIERNLAESLNRVLAMATVTSG